MLSLVYLPPHYRLQFLPGRWRTYDIFIIIILYRPATDPNISPLVPRSCNCDIMNNSSRFIGTPIFSRPYLLPPFRFRLKSQVDLILRCSIFVELILKSVFIVGRLTGRESKEEVRRRGNDAQTEISREFGHGQLQSVDHKLEPITN